MSWTHRTLIVPASLAPTCRALAAGVPGGSGMWVTPLSPTGEAPATHYISAGKLMTSFVALLEDPQALSAATGVPLEQATAILSACVVSTGAPRAVLGAMGLQMMEAA